MRVRTLLLVLLLVLTAIPATVLAIDAAPFHFSMPAVVDNDDAAEVLTIRGYAPGQGDTFIRVSMLNAGFGHGELKLTFKQQSSQGTFYGEEKFARGNYTVAKDHLLVQAGKHAVEVKGGQLVGQFQFESGLQASFVLAPQAGSLRAQDRGNGGYIFRNLLVPMGKLTVNATEGARSLANLQSTAFAMHDASTCTATKVYDRSVQLHHLTAGSFLIVDYIVGPSERQHRPLGFIVASGKGKTLVTDVAKETREAERVDDKTDYQVPWQVTVLGKRGEAKLAVRATAERQLSREDDLAGLSWVARKAVGMFFHPYAYVLKGTATVELQAAATEAALSFDTGMRYKYSQVRE